MAITHDSLSRRSGVNRPGSAADTAYTYEPDSDLATLGHAFTAGGAAGAVTFTYGRDASSKITSLAWSQPGFGWTPPVGYSRSYGTANVLNQIPSEGGTAISWNTDGNMTSDGTTTFTWTYGNRMSGASRSGMTAAYDYDSDDRRTRKTVNGTVTRTMWSGADEVAELDAAGNVLRRFVPDGTGGMDARLATVDALGTVAWHHTDHLGSVIATSNASGQVTALATYSPYGEFGSGQTAPPAGSPFGYTGRQFDPETGLYQYRARYYSPRLGRFLSTDPVGTKDDPNLYLYVGNDPVNKVDPTGECALTLCIPEGAAADCVATGPGCPAGAIVGGVVAGVVTGGAIACGVSEGCRNFVGDVARGIGDFFSGGTRSEARSHGPGPLADGTGQQGDAQGRPHSTTDDYGGRGYTTYGPTDPITGQPTGQKQYRPPDSGRSHGGIPRPNVKEQPPGTRPGNDGAIRPGREVVRPPRPEEVRPDPRRRE